MTIRTFARDGATRARQAGEGKASPFGSLDGTIKEISEVNNKFGNQSTGIELGAATIWL
jgi:hypothetical protein